MPMPTPMKPPKPKTPKPYLIFHEVRGPSLKTFKRLLALTLEK